MTYPLPPDVAERIHDLVARGQYGNEADVLRAALKALERDEGDLAAIRAGIADYEAGRYQTLEEFEADFRKRHQIADDA
jgi:putative addiction module CopG family antidote